MKRKRKNNDMGPCPMLKNNNNNNISSRKRQHTRKKELTCYHPLTPCAFYCPPPCTCPCLLPPFPCPLPASFPPPHASLPSLPFPSPKLQYTIPVLHFPLLPVPAHYLQILHTHLLPCILHSLAFYTCLCPFPALLLMELWRGGGWWQVEEFCGEMDGGWWVVVVFM